jgi:hypothetical protein
VSYFRYPEYKKDASTEITPTPTVDRATPTSQPTRTLGPKPATEIALEVSTPGIDQSGDQSEEGHTSLLGLSSGVSAVLVVIIAFVVIGLLLVIVGLLLNRRE